MASPRATELEHALAPVARRIRLVRALRSFAFFVLLGGALATLAALLHAAGRLDGLDLRRVQVGSGLLAIWGFALGWMRAPRPLETALLVDHTHPLGGRIASGISLAQTDARSSMAELAIDDALAHTAGISVPRALSITEPRWARAAGLVVLLSIASAFLAPSTPAIEPPPEPRAHLVTLAVHEDDLAMLRDRVASLPERRRTAAVRAEIDALNAILEDLSAREVDRTEALRRLGEIAEHLRSARPGALDATIEALTRLERPLSRSPLSESIGEALGEQDLSTAATEMDRLAERIEREPPSRAELERLREAMAAAARELDPEAMRREREALEEQRDRLLDREEEEASLSEAERTERTEERERELERLRRDIEERREREAALDALRRELEEALGEREDSTESESGESGESGLESAAEDLHRFADEAAGDGEREELAREVEALREMIRRMREGGSGEDGSNGEGGESEGSPSGEGEGRMDRFVLRARGEGSEGEGEGMPIGVPGEAGGEEGEGTTEGSAGEGGEGERAETSPGAGGEGGEGEGEGAGESEMLVLGEGSSRLELPGMGGAGEGPEEGPGSGGDGRSDSEGSGAGTGPGDDLTDPTGRSGEHTTVRVAGEEGAGATRSEVIRTSAARGFASRSYRDVYGDYRTHAEEALDDEEIPPGYRFYVERYFQLIRPRE
jgi:hypothetical protein